MSEFIRSAGLLGVRAEHMADAVAAADIIRGEALGGGTTRIMVSGEVRRRAPDLITAVGEHLDVVAALNPASVRDAPLALTVARAAYAETGSVPLAEPNLGDRAVGMLSRALVVVLPTARLRDGLDDVVAELRAIARRPGGGYATVMSGPSRTADIERVLTVGVQGPGRVVVLFVDELT